MEGTFTYSNVKVRWTLAEDGEYGEVGGKEWVLQVRLIDFSVSRRYPVRISPTEAEAEAKAICPVLVQIAQEWLK